MILIILFLICLIISIFYLFSDSKQNRIKCYSSCCYDEDDIFEEEMMDIMLQNCEEEVMEDMKSSVLVYPDPYEMNPEDMMYLGEDGELLEDL